MTAAVATLPSPRYRMKELEERTGVPRKTIHFYLSEGLLPRPHKTARNQAWYDDGHVERIALIRELQEKRFLPLRVIKSVVTRTGEGSFTEEQRALIRSLRASAERGAAAASATPGEALADRVPLAALVERTPFTGPEIWKMHRLGWIRVHGGDASVRDDADGGADGGADAGAPWVSAADAELVEGWASIQRAGLTAERGFGPRDFALFDRLVTEMVEGEMQLFLERLAGLGEGEREGLLERLVPLVNAAVDRLHWIKLRQYLTALPLPEGDDEGNAGA